MSPRARRAAAVATPTAITAALLRKWPLPALHADDDKESRGRVLVIGGAPELPGALLLAGTAALRAGAGKLQLATCRSIAPALGVAVPEALVLGLPETARGAIARGAAALLKPHLREASAVLVGPGMVGARSVAALLPRVVRTLDDATLVLDAAALAPLSDVADALNARHGRVVLTPHAGEMATALGIDKREVERAPMTVALDAARAFGAVVALKGGETIVATPTGDLFRYAGGRVGLATSGSGDTLAGLVAGLAARGAAPVQAACWAVYLHGEAGNVLARRMGEVGFLARELLAEVPLIMRRLRET